MALVAGCSDNSPTDDSSQSLDGAGLLGLVNNRTFRYLQTDTVTTFNPVFTRTVTTRQRTVLVTGSGVDWVVSDSAQPMLNLKLTDAYVLLNGCWAKRGSVDSLFYYAQPSVVMHRAFQDQPTWKDLTPLYRSAPSETRLAFIYAYFGFYADRKYVGAQSLIVPAGAYTAQRFDVKLTLGSADTTTAGTATEFYAPNVGPVRMVLKGQGLVRSWDLISYQ